MFLGKETNSAPRDMDRNGGTHRGRTSSTWNASESSDPCVAVEVAQQQFLEIARGISAKADVVILDEPTAGYSLDLFLVVAHGDQLFVIWSGL